MLCSSALTPSNGDFIYDTDLNSLQRAELVDLMSKEKQAQDAIEQEAKRSGQYYVSNRWLGGMLTNYKTIRLSIKRLKELEALFEKSEIKGYTKKEVLNLLREKDKLSNCLSGIKNMGSLPDALFVIDVNNEKIAIREANRLGIPVIGIVDTNSSPDNVDYVVPGNDDAYRAIRFYCQSAANLIIDTRGSMQLEEIKPVKAAKAPAKAKKVVYTGGLDEFFNCCYEPLEWRSLRFEHKSYFIQDYQGLAQINYTHPDIPYTRKVEHKHFNYDPRIKNTIVTTEYPDKWEIGKEKYYPVNDIANNQKAKSYMKKIDRQKYVFGGRLATYRYYDMHQVIASAMKRTLDELRSY